jgi:hypothetical protein
MVAYYNLCSNWGPINNHFCIYLEINCGKIKQIVIKRADSINEKKLDSRLRGNDAGGV